MALNWETPLDRLAKGQKANSSSFSPDIDRSTEHGSCLRLNCSLPTAA